MLCIFRVIYVFAITENNEIWTFLLLLLIFSKALTRFFLDFNPYINGIQKMYNKLYYVSITSSIELYTFKIYINDILGEIKLLIESEI